MRHSSKVFAEIVEAKIELVIKRELTADEKLKVAEASNEYWADDYSSDTTATYLINELELNNLLKDK